MKVTRLLSGIIMCFLLSGCTNSNNKEHLIQEAIVPQPTDMKRGEGSFVFSAQTKCSVENEQQKKVVEQLSDLFSSAAGFDLPIVLNDETAEIVFISDTNLKKEAYALEISPEKIQIKAADLSGFFYAVQTIRQLLPAAIESKKNEKGFEWSVPALIIQDEPRFGYRGMLLDVARCFIPKESVMRIIDCAAMLKINKLHFHLVDDNGWRLEIKKYPKLTEVGAWRVKRDVPYSERRNPVKGEPTPVGGFFTQEDIKEIVEYASARQIDVIPEIEMPAHTNSSLTAYPHLTCPVVDRFIGVLPGLGGKNSGIVYCAGNDSVFTFLEDVIDEVIELFPSEYIHLGGDEASKENWKKCPKCQSRMKKEHITHEEDLQGYFMKRMSRYAQSKGRKVIGWDELTNSELPDDIIILGWQGYGQAALKAARQGHNFIMTPARITYLIRYQGPQWFEPVTFFGNITLKTVYDYEPIQEDWEPEIVPLLMGVQASLWTEFCVKPEDVEYLAFPRLAALAETAWAPRGAKDWAGFLKRLDTLTKHWEMMGINYAHSMYNLDHIVKPDNKGGVKVAVSCIRPDVEIRYTLDGSEPNEKSMLYQDTLLLDKSVMVRAATFMDGVQKGKILDLDLNWNKATGKKVISQNNKDYVLINGLRGSKKYSDFEWVGWYNQDVSFIIDLQKQEDIKQIILGCITNYGMAVHIPTDITVSISDDGQSFIGLAKKSFKFDEIFKEGAYAQDVTFDDLSVKGRYVKLEMKNPGICPEDHVRPGQNIWMYFDEIIIE